MNTYIQLPENLYSNIDIDKLEKTFRQNLDKYFSDYDLETFGEKYLDHPRVIFMGQHKEKYTENQVSTEVNSFFKAFFKNDLIKTDVKLNYQKFNPKFRPESDKPDSNLKKQQFNQEIPSEFDYEKLSFNYSAIEPRYSFEQVVLPQQVIDSIDIAIGIMNVEHKVFDEWGLRNIIPETGTTLNFFGPPGTGKSMTAEAVAHKLGKKIIKATYADIESKYHGEGPKMVKAIFKAAEREDAVLFLDEADSLLSKRLTNVTDGSSQAINSMRSQLLISLEQHKGLVIFASNLVVNYDKAFLSRMTNIKFDIPSEQERIKIWNNHLKTGKVRIPLAENVDVIKLSKKYDFCGREIKNSIKNACVKAAVNGQESVTQEDFIEACNKILNEKTQAYFSQDYTKIETAKPSDDLIKQTIQAEIDKRNPKIKKLKHS